jgi:hypothetical protein
LDSKVLIEGLDTENDNTQGESEEVRLPELVVMSTNDPLSLNLPFRTPRKRNHLPSLSIESRTAHGNKMAIAGLS